MEFLKLYSVRIVSLCNCRANVNIVKCSLILWKVVSLDSIHFSPHLFPNVLIIKFNLMLNLPNFLRTVLIHTINCWKMLKNTRTPPKNNLENFLRPLSFSLNWCKKDCCTVNNYRKIRTEENLFLNCSKLM